MKPSYFIRLTPKVEAQLHALLSKGKSLVRETKKATVLRLVAGGLSAEAASKFAGVSPTTARSTCRKFTESGLDGAIHDKKRPGHDWLLTTKQEAELAAMVCSSAPKGLARWTITTIRTEAINRGIVERIGRTTVFRFLRRHKLKPWREKNVVRGNSQRGIYPADGGRPIAL